MWGDGLHGFQTNTNSSLGGGGSQGLLFPGLVDNSSMLPRSLLPPVVHSISPNSALPHLPFDGHEFYGESNFSPAMRFACDGGVFGPEISSVPMMGSSERLLHGKGLNSMSLFGSLHTELGKMSAKEIMDAKALAASKSHSEAERRRRQRINGHLAKLRSLLPNTTKTDKASLLAEVIEHVKELKRQQKSMIAEESLLPTEADELMVDAANDEDGKLVVRASFCCEDREDLIPDLVKALKSLKLKTSKAEIATIGGRVKNVLFITGDEDYPEFNHQYQECVVSIQEALQAIISRKAVSGETSSSSGVKRQRTKVVEEQGSI
ncbi:transcription factor bHLH30-like [Typha latifolia]|uniref:transcription factor bHLH30-like n=1 Tax=Typha latifolia TaxID=4733 RepID=UPI003C2CA847